MTWNRGQLILLLPALVLGIPYGSKVDELYSNDDYDNHYENGNGEKEEVAVMGTPEFVSEPKKAMVNEGDTLRLPCIVDRLEGFVLLWKKNADIITVGSQIINKADTRIKLEEEQNGNYLVISLAEETDAGEYVCQISAYKPTELKHSVEIRVEPVIRLTPESGLLTVKEGDSATLQCDITAGNPTPEIIWRRRERMMPNGEEEIAGSVISFDGVNRHHSGHYICSADNGFGPQAVTAEIKLDVQHKPTVEQEQTFIHTGAGDQTEVVCVVHASPHAKVTWLHNDQPIDTGNSLINKRGNKHTLMLVDINEESFGKYTCKAKNDLGEDQRTTEISARQCGKPHAGAHDLTFDDTQIRIVINDDESPSESSYETFTQVSVSEYQTVVTADRPSEDLKQEDDEDEVKRTSVQTSGSRESTGSPDHLDQENDKQEASTIEASSQPVVDNDNNLQLSKDTQVNLVTILHENSTPASSIPTSSENFKYYYEMFNISRDGDTQTTLEKVNETETSGKDYRIFMNVNYKDMNSDNTSLEDVHFEEQPLFSENSENEFHEDGTTLENNDGIGNTTEIILDTNPTEGASKNVTTDLSEEDNLIEKKENNTKEEIGASEDDNASNPSTPLGQSGNAHEAKIKSKAKSEHASQYKLEWTANSKSPVTEFKVQYKKKNDATWTDMVVAASSLENDDYTGHYEFKSLQSAAIYDVRIASSNQFGYNNFGKIFSFATKGAVYPVQSQSVSSATSFLKSSALVVTSVLTLFVAMA